MSRFSACLEEIIRRRGEPIARIAKNAGLERTSIHKALKDERILPYPSLKKLIRYFQLTLSEARELNLCYDMLLQGEAAYSTHREICQLMSDLSQLHFSAFGYKTDVSGELPGGGRLIQGRAEVQYTLQAVLRRETDAPGAAVHLYLGEDQTLPEVLVSLWRSEKRFTVHQIVALRPESEGETARSRTSAASARCCPRRFCPAGSTTRITASPTRSCTAVFSPCRTM